MKKTFLFSLILITQLCHGQDQTQYLMAREGFNTMLHPEVIPSRKYFLQVPLASSFGFSYGNNAFAYHDIAKRRKDDSLSFDIDKALSKMGENNFIGLTASTTILGFGMRVDSDYFSFSINERFYFGLHYSKDLINLIDKGNGPYIGQNLHFSNTSFDLTHFREYAFGFSRQWTEKLKAGAKLKILYGLENFSSTNKEISFYTSPDDYSLNLSSDVAVNTSSYVNSENGYDDLSVGKYIFGGLGNKGLSFDLGASYTMNEKWTFNASILDLGFIHWKANVKNYRTSQGSYRYNGIDIRDFIEDSTRTAQNLLDSLSDAYRTDETSDPYTSYLHSSVILSADHQLNERTAVSGVLNLRFFNGSILPALSAGVTRKLGNVFDVSVSYSYLNRSFDNLGIGLYLHAGAFNFFGVTDNVFGFFAPLDFQTAGFRAGIQFAWN